MRYAILYLIDLLNKLYILQVLDWFKGIVQKLFMEETIISKGIPLQICDVFLSELNKVDAQEISNENLAAILEPFLHAVAKCRNKILIQRIIDKIFLPLLENNVTEEVKSESSEEDYDNINYDPNLGKWVDGGKLHPRTQKEVQKLIDQKYHFPNFNILLYSQEYLFKTASSKDTREENRDFLYKLYDKALNLEPEPSEPELTFSQRMLLNRAQTFITKRMQRRMRVNVQKRQKKLAFKLQNLISNQIMQ